MSDKEKAQPAIAQLVEHLTVERCRNQMVPGSIPGGRIFDMQPLYRIIQPATTEIQFKISYGLLGSPNGSKRARELKPSILDNHQNAPWEARTPDLEVNSLTL